MTGVASDRDYPETAIDAVYAAEELITQALQSTEELVPLARSAERIMDDLVDEVRSPADKSARQVEDEIYESVVWLRGRCAEIEDVSSAARRRLESARYILKLGCESLDERELNYSSTPEDQALRRQMDALSEAVAIALPITTQITTDSGRAIEKANELAHAHVPVDQGLHQTGKAVARTGGQVAVVSQVAMKAWERAASAASAARASEASHFPRAGFEAVSSSEPGR